jgi:hypothetical protein
VKHLVSTKFLTGLMLGVALASSAATLVGFHAGRELAREILTPDAPMIVWTEEVPDPERSFDLGSDFERCLAAMDAAELPGWMWECREYEPVASPAP